MASFHYHQSNKNWSLQEIVIHNRPRWPDYIPFQKSEFVWSGTFHYFYLWVWKIYKIKCSPSSFYNFLQNFNLMLTETVMTIFPRWPVWNVIWGSVKTLASSDYISETVVRQDLKFGSKVQTDFFSNGFLFYLLKLCSERVIAKIQWWLVLVEILELAKTLTSSDHIPENIARQTLKFGHGV